MRDRQHRFNLFLFTSCMHTYLLSALTEFNQASHGGLSVLDTWVCSWRSWALKWEATFFWFSRERGDANEIMEWNTYRHTLYGDGEDGRELDNE